MDNKQQPTLLDNWIGWLQVRIPSLKKSHNAFWIKKALEGYKSDSYNMDQTHAEIAQVPDKVPSAGEYYSKRVIETNFDLNIAEVMHEYAVLLAKWHRERQEEAIQEKVNKDISDMGLAGSERYIISCSIENAYNESLIK